MKKRICCIVAIVMMVLGGVAVGNAGNAKRCEKTIKHILSVLKSGDPAVAKLLIDRAIDDRKIMGCDSKRYEQMVQLRRDVYMTYIIARLHIAKEEVLVRNDGHRALRNIRAAVKAAEKIDLELKGADGLYAVAFFSAACQDLDEAKIADQEGDIELRDGLREEATRYLSWALALDPRVEEMIKEAFGL